MPTPRTAVLVLAASAVVALTGCTAATAEPTDALTGTTWSGVDSLDRETTFHFQPDGTVRVSYFGDTFDDELDTWKLSGTSLTVDIYQGDAAGTATYVGQLTEAGLALNATTDASNESFTVQLTEEQ